jgi:peptidoglycan/LPS O-acetylase OafA/YrhL
LYYDRSVIHTFLSNKHVSALGDLSYGLFIFQYPMWVTCSYFAKPEFEKSAWFFLLYFFCLIFVAAFINKYLEKPVLNWLRREKGRRGN